MPIENSVTVTAGSTVVDGYLTQFVAAPSDTFILNGLSFVVERHETSARLILNDPWPGEDLTDQANWELVRTSPYWQSTVTVNSKITDLIQRLEAGLPFKPDAVGTLSERDAYDEQEKGFTFLRIDTDPFLLYVKRSADDGDWTPGQALRGKDAAGVEFRVDPLTFDLQFRRIGDAAWTAVMNGDLDAFVGPYRIHAEQSAQAAALSATASEESAGRSLLSANASAQSEQASAGSESRAKASEDAAKQSETASAQSAAASEALNVSAGQHDQRAENWAEAAAEIEPGRFSARVHAERSKASEDAAKGSENRAATSETNAASSAQTATQQRELSVTARQGAEAARDTADQHKAAGQTARTGAETARTGSETAQGLSETARAGAEAARDVSVAAKDTSVAAKDTAVAAKDTATTKAGEAAQSASNALYQANQSMSWASSSNQYQAYSQKWATQTHAEVLPGEGYGAKKYAQDASASAAAADGSADAAAASAQTSLDAANDSLTQRQGSETAREGSEAARDVAGGHSADAQVARDLARRFASEAEDVLVDGTGYSAYHWAMKAMSYTNGQASNLTVVPAENLDSTDVQSALEELALEKAPMVHGHTASEISGLDEAMSGKVDKLYAGPVALDWVESTYPVMRVDTTDIRLAKKDELDGLNTSIQASLSTLVSTKANLSGAAFQGAISTTSTITVGEGQAESRIIMRSGAGGADHRSLFSNGVGSIGFLRKDGTYSNYFPENGDMWIQHRNGHLSTWMGEKANLASPTFSGGIITGQMSGQMVQGYSNCSIQVRNTGTTGDWDLAAIGFHCLGYYGIQLGLRADGYFGLGGWSAVAWRWYSDNAGGMVAAGNIGAYSDPDLKEDRQIIENALDIIDNLTGEEFTWNWKTNLIGSPGERDVGVPADKVQEHFPLALGYSIPDDDNDGHRWRIVYYPKLVPLTIEGIKALRREHRELKEKLEETLERLAALEAR